MVDHGSVAAIALETVVASGEVGVADAQGGGDQTADIHLGTGTEQHAVGIDQEDPAIGVQLAHDFGAVDAKYAVKCNRVGAGLVEGDLLPGTNIEALPVDRGTCAGGVHLHLLVLLPDRRLAADDLSGLGQVRSEGNAQWRGDTGCSEGN
ncbi:hypothetical protein D9M71_716760 [compost metagenome]